MHEAGLNECFLIRPDNKDYDVINQSTGTKEHVRCCWYFIRLDGFRLVMAELKRLDPPNTFEELIKGIRLLFKDDNINVEEVQSFMESYKSNPSEWSSFAMFDPHR